MLPPICSPVDLAMHRAEALARMTSSVNVFRFAEFDVQNEETGADSGWMLVARSVPFRLGGASRGAGGSSESAAGGVTTQTANRVGHFPHDLAALRDGDAVRIVAGEHAGREFRVIEVVNHDQATALRCPLQEMTLPEGVSDGDPNAVGQ